MILYNEQYHISEIKMKRIKEDMPEQCRNCSQWRVVDLVNERVYCPYMINRCIL